MFWLFVKKILKVTFLRKNRDKKFYYIVDTTNSTKHPSEEILPGFYKIFIQ